MITALGNKGTPIPGYKLYNRISNGLPTFLIVKTPV